MAYLDPGIHVLDCLGCQLWSHGSQSFYFTGRRPVRSLEVSNLPVPVRYRALTQGIGGRDNDRGLTAATGPVLRHTASSFELVHSSTSRFIIPQSSAIRKRRDGLRPG